MIFIITILLLAADFYYLKNIAGRRLVGLRWWNEVDPQTGDSQWVFESSEPGTKTVNATDSRFFWLALYVQPLLWVLLAVFALVRLQFLWLPLVGESCSLLGPPRVAGRMVCCVRGIGRLLTLIAYPVIALVLTIMNAMAFSRCDKFSHASNIAGSALYSGGLAGSIASNMVGRLFSRS